MANFASRKTYYNVVIIGEAGAGKTALLYKYSSGKFMKEYKATIGADFHTKHVSAVHRKFNYSVTLQMWDTAGQERFTSLPISFFRGANAVVIVYDITNKESFDSIEFWKNKFMEHTGQNDTDWLDFPTLLLANKKDLVDETWMRLSQKYYQSSVYSVGMLLVFGFCRRSVMNIMDIMKLCLRYHGDHGFYDGSDVAKDHNMLYYETSALNGHNIEKAMKEILIQAVEYEEKMDLKPGCLPPKIQPHTSYRDYSKKSKCGC